MTLGELIENKRIEHNISKTALAEATLSTPQAVWKWSEDKAIPNPQSTILICDTLGITPNEWFDALREVA